MTENMPQRICCTNSDIDGYTLIPNFDELSQDFIDVINKNIDNLGISEEVSLILFLSELFLDSI